MTLEESQSRNLANTSQLEPKNKSQTPTKETSEVSLPTDATSTQNTKNTPTNLASDTITDPSRYMVVLNRVTGEYDKIDMFTGEKVLTNQQFGNKYIFSQEIAMGVCNLIREGMTLPQICKLPNMPSLDTLFYWRSFNKIFKSMLKMAIRDRADMYHDEAVHTLKDLDRKYEEAITNIDEYGNCHADSLLKKEKMKFEGYVRLAEKGNPDLYAAKPAVSDNTFRPTTIMINTGLPSIQIGKRGEIKDGIEDAVVVGNGEDKGEGEKVRSNSANGEVVTATMVLNRNDRYVDEGYVEESDHEDL